MSKTEVTTMAEAGGGHCGSERSAWSERHVHPDPSPGPPLVGPKSTTRAAKTFSSLDGSLHPQKGTRSGSSWSRLSWYWAWTGPGPVTARGPGTKVPMRWGGEFEAPGLGLMCPEDSDP